jgi:hypothetical protein
MASAAASVVTARTKRRREVNGGDNFFLSSVPDEEERICSYDVYMLMLDGQVAYFLGTFVDFDRLVLHTLLICA